MEIVTTPTHFKILFRYHPVMVEKVKQIPDRWFDFREKVWEWYLTNIWGGPWNDWPIAQPFSKVFNSLLEAKKQVDDWKKEATYHYFN